MMGRITNLLAIGLCPRQTYVEDRVVAQNCTHGPNDRGCWTDGFNILSDLTN